MTTKKRWIVLAVLIFSSASLLPAERSSIWQGIEPYTRKRDIGVLFSVNDLLFDIESYQQGLGVKVGLNKWVLRGTADILLNTGIDPFSLSLGGVLERHILPGPLSIYWGPSLETGITISETSIDEDNWTQIINLPLLKAGCVFGIEVFLFEFLSIFVEYQASLALGFDIYRVSTAGSVDSTSEGLYRLETGLGNSGMFGIVFYLTRRNDSAQPDLAKQE